MSVAGTIAKNSVFTIIANMSELLIALVTGIVLARSLGTEQYGIYVYLMWFLGVVAVIVNLGLAEMSKRFIAEATGRKTADEPRGFAQLTLMLRGGAALLICLVIIVTSGYWARLSGNSSNQIYFVLIAFASVPHALTYALISIFRGFQKYEYAAYILLGNNSLRLVLVIILMALGYGIWEVLIVNISVLGVAVLIGLFLLQRLIPLKGLFLPSPLDTSVRKRALKYAMTMAGVLGVDYLAYQQAEVFFIGIYCPVEAVGFYHIAFRLANMSMMLLPSAFGFVLLPAIAEQFGKGDMEKIKAIYLTSLRYLMAAAVPLATGAITLAGPIISVLYGAEYGPAVILMQILIVPVAILNVGRAAGAVIFGINRPGFILKINIFMAFINIGLSLLLISRYGVIGASIAKSVPLILVTLLCIGFASRRTGATWPVRDTIKITVASLIMGLAVYAVQNQLTAGLSLGLGIPLGIVIYIIGIFAFRVVREQDLAMLKKVFNSLPPVLREYSVALIGLMEKFVIRTRPGSKIGINQ